MQELKSFLLKQKYPHQINNYGLDKAMALDNDLLRKVQEKTEENVIPYVSTFNLKDPEMYHVIIENKPILQEDETMRNILSKFKFIKSKRQPYNLKRVLTKAKCSSMNYWGA